jgi:hypothetical protein
MAAQVVVASPGTQGGGRGHESSLCRGTERDELAHRFRDTWWHKS